MGTSDPTNEKIIEQSSKQMNISREEAKAFAKKHMQLHGLDKSPTYFIPAKFLEFYDAPRVSGIIVVPGIKDDMEVLIVVPATINNGKIEEIEEYFVKINDNKPFEVKYLQAGAFPPCPPHPPNPCPQSLIAATKEL